MVEIMKSPEGEYRVVSRGERPPVDHDQYWERVKRALQHVFGKDPAPADQLRQKVNDALPDTQTAFYHADPFEVAADLAGRRHQSVTPDEEARYLEVLDSQDRPKAEELAVTHPEA